MKLGDDKFLIKGLGGKKKLSGSISVGGAKNASLKLFAASLLVPGSVLFENVPDIEDIHQMTELLKDLGAEAERTGPNSYHINSAKVRGGNINKDIAKRFRASIVLVGPLLARFGKVSLPHPGGDMIGARPIDFFIEAFKKMGASIILKNDEYIFSASKKLRGTTIFFPFQSVTATEAVMIAATLASGETVIKNAAMEPEVLDLIQFLSACGASIKGGGTPTITIEGRAKLHPPDEVYEVMPDRLEAGSFVILGALAASNLEIKNCEPRHLESLFELLKRSGVALTVKKNSIIVKNHTAKLKKAFKAVDVRTHEYPGFPTDLQAPMAVFLTQAFGNSVIHENIFDGRLNYTESLGSMGANIRVWSPHRAEVKGPTPLHGKTLEGPDIRAGLSYLLAAIIAKGDSTISNVRHIDRGYEKIEKRLRGIGVNIERVR